MTKLSDYIFSLSDSKYRQCMANMYKSRKNHKLDEWHDFCHWIETLPYSKLIIGDAK